MLPRGGEVFINSLYPTSIYPMGMSVKGQRLAASKQAFGKRLREAREGFRLTQAALARLVGDKSQKAVSEWESGKAEPDIEMLGRLAAVLTTTVGWLVAGEGKPPVLTGRHAQEVSDELVRRAAEIEREAKGA